MNKIKTKFFCTFLSDDPDDKISAGFYRIQHRNTARAVFSHSYFALTYVIEGKGRFTDFAERTYDLIPGSLLLRHPNQPRIIERLQPSEDGWLEFSCAIPQSFYNSLLTLRILDENVTHLALGLNEILLILGDKLICSLPASDSEAGRGYAMSCFLELLSMIYKLNFRKADNPEEERKCFLAEVDRLIGVDFSELPDMRSIADQMNIGYESFRKKFAVVVGQSPHAYLLRKRLEQANYMLLHSELSLKEIAFSLGYADASCFSRQYHKFYGVSPRKIRQEGVAPALLPVSGR